MNPNLQIVMLAKAMSSPTRVFVLAMLGVGPCTVAEVADAANISKTAAVYHLTRLVGVGLASVRWKGKARLYRTKEKWYLACATTDVSAAS